MRDCNLSLHTLLRSTQTVMDLMAVRFWGECEINSIDCLGVSISVFTGFISAHTDCSQI